MFGMDPAGNHKRLGYYPDKQDWHECQGGAFWIGVQKDSPPAPTELERPNKIGGHFVKLDDGNEYLIPVARWHESDGTGRIGVPQSIKLDKEGKWTSHVNGQYGGFFDRAVKVYEMFVGADEGDDWTPHDDLDFAAEAIGFNYYMTKWEVSALGLFNTDTVGDLLRATIDYPGFMALVEAQKKTEERIDSSSSTPGDEETYRDTARLSQT